MKFTKIPLTSLAEIESGLFLDPFSDVHRGPQASHARVRRIRLYRRPAQATETVVAREK